MLAKVCAVALAAAADVATPPPSPSAIMNGQVAETCQWPATVLMDGCSGTLVHPRIVIYAAHCPNVDSVRFGVYGNDRSVPVDYCRAAPEYPSTGYDYRYCRLSQAVGDVPVAPPLLGCERDQLQVGTPVVMVGYGSTSNGGDDFGTKRWVDATIAGFPSDGKIIGLWYADSETGICSGDSGGSAYVELDDGSWRSFAITVTTAGPCGGSSQSVPMWNKIAWVEQDSGIDITPCHDADGAWNPSPDCGGFPMDPDDGSALTWAAGCGPGETSGASAVCGPPYGEPRDDAAPTIEIVEPESGTHLTSDFVTPIEVSASDDWGVLDVTVGFDDAEQAVLREEPYRLGAVTFPEGTWEITASARDWSGNTADAASVILEVVGGDTGTGTDMVTGTGEGPTVTEGTGTTYVEPTTGGAVTSHGCACHTSPRRRAPLAILLGIVLATCRRPRQG
jgi:hypothetical protein